jgi:hypothetical protein
LNKLEQPGTPEHPIETDPRLVPIGHADLVIERWQAEAKARQPQPAPEPTGEEWWTYPTSIKPPYYARGNRYVLVTSETSYVFVMPGEQPGDWLSERDSWGRIITHGHDPELEFRSWLSTVKHNGFSRGWEPHKASPYEEALRRNTAHDPEWEELLRSRFGMPKPATRLEGQLFDPGGVFTDTTLASKFHVIDAGEYLVKHIMGDFGVHGCHGEIKPTALDRACPAAALQPARNALAIEAGAGVVCSQYDVRVEGVGPVSVFVRTLIDPSGPDTTGIGYGF